ncbi:hypothetical protein R6Q59_033339 [Mikania micrantha]
MSYSIPFQVVLLFFNDVVIVVFSAMLCTRYWLTGCTGYSIGYVAMYLVQCFVLVTSCMIMDCIALTYMAKEMKEWKEDCGILEESSRKQHDQLLDLRFKYLSKILLSDINILHDEVTKEVKIFEELDEEVKRQMRRNVHKRIQKRKTQD